MEILFKYFPDLTPLQRERYLRLNELLRHWNRRINLVSRKDIEHLPERHILHSLGIAVHARFSPSGRVLDVGTGGGFPGLPLAILFPDTQFILIDSVGKKIRAVEEISRSLQLANVRCLQVRAEDFPQKVQHVVSRAVAELGTFAGWLRNSFSEDPESDNPTGIWYLKGGDLENEMKSFPGSRIYDLKDTFSEAYFESKKLVWIPAKGLK